MNRKTLPGAVLLALLAYFLPSCGFMYPDPVVEEEEKEGPLFDKEYYSLNAKQYLQGGNYWRAREQFEQELKTDPGSRPAMLAIGFCSLFIGRNQGHHGNLKSAEQELRRAERSFADLWNGTIEEDTATAPPTLSQWSAAMGLALSERALANLATLQIRQLEVMEVSNLDDAKRDEVKGRLDECRKFRKRYYGLAREKFERLAQMKHAPPETFLNLGDLCTIARDDRAAVAHYKHYLEIAESSRKLWAKRRSAAEEKLAVRDQEAAARIIDEKLETNLDKTVSTCKRISEVHVANKEYEEALLVLERARRIVLDHSGLDATAELPPDFTDLYYRIAACEGECERYDDAIAHLNLYVKSRTTLDEEATMALQLRNRFEAERKSKGR